MKKLLLLTLLITLPLIANAERGIRHNGKLIDKGDNLSEVYKVWGRPDYSVSSEKTCNRIIRLKRTYCSYTRKVWKRGKEYWMVQHSGSLIIKIGWTRFVSKIAEDFS